VSTIFYYSYLTYYEVKLIKYKQILSALHKYEYVREEKARPRASYGDTNKYIILEFDDNHEAEMVNRNLARRRKWSRNWS